MSVFFISDLHFGHKKIAEYMGHARGGVKTVKEHDEWIIEQWNKTVTKNDVTWVLGDVAFSKEGLEKVKRLNGVKHLILGNHDTFPIHHYQKHFNKIHGFLKYKDFWLSHAPILTTRGAINIHGHTHSEIMIDKDDRVCVCVETLGGYPVSLELMQAIQLSLY